jgi:leader peptidase (prepilin peptidase)/N-methyltransferase
LIDFSCLSGDCQIAFDLVVLASESWNSAMVWLQGMDGDLPFFLPIVAACLGAVLASFAGVVAERLPAIKGWNRDAPDPSVSLSHPPSHCTSCRTPISKVSLIPVVGWLLAKGECENCGARVPWRYPAIEAGTALASFLIALLFEPSTEMFTLLLLVWSLVFVSWLDWEAHEIPDFLTIPLFFAGMLFSPFDPEMVSRLLGAAAGGLFLMGAFALVSKMMDLDAYSYGDVALAIAGGAWAGLCGLFPFLLITCVVYVAYALPRRRMAGEVWSPMGPALALGLVATCVFGLAI